MAIDTAERRFSFLGIGNPTIKHPIPQGSLGKPGRATLLDLYSGITLNDPGAGGTTILNFERGKARGIMRGVARGVR